MGKEKSNSCIVMLKYIMRKFKNIEVDVKEGHFAVFSVNSEEDPKKFILELHWLNNPFFLKLLKQAEDEYGFQQKGVLQVPCRAAELQKILEFKIERYIYIYIKMFIIARDDFFKCFFLMFV